MGRVHEGRALEWAMPGRAVRWVVLLAAAAWAVPIAGQTAGLQGVVQHDVIIEHTEFALPIALVLFVLAWQIMIGAMMLPSTLAAVRTFAWLSHGRARPRANVATFVGAYFTVWTAFGLGALAFDAGVHALVDSWGWLAQHPSLIAATVLVLAGMYQFVPTTWHCLKRCREPDVLLARYPGVEGAWRSGLRHAATCLGSNWLLMLVMFAIGIHALWWIALLTLALVAEKVLPGWRRTVPTVGVALCAAGIWTALG